MKKSSFLFWKVNRKNGPTWFIIAYRDFSVVFFDNHFDHIGAIPALQATYPDLPVYVHDNDLKVINHPLNQLPPEYPAIGQPKNLASTESLAELEGLEVLETPGHTPGGVCYYSSG